MSSPTSPKPCSAGRERASDDLGANARELARERLSIERFTRDWNTAFARVG